ncbi:MAG: hypothetical protein WAU28_05125, partial [Candidatus Moraniibacteriota bacterium]
IQGYTYMLSSLGSGDKCDLPGLESRIRKKGFVFTLGRIAVGVFGAVFTLGGWILFFSSLREETNLKRKRAMAVTGAYALIIFATLLSVASGISIRYFIVVEFMPFLLLGFWIRFFQKNMPRIFSSRGVSGVILLFVGLNLWTITDAVSAYREGRASTDNVAVYGEVEVMSRYILGQSASSRQVFLAGKSAYLSRYGKPLEYFAKQEGVILGKVHQAKSVSAGAPFFYILKKVSPKNPLPEMVDGFGTTQGATFGNVSILELVRKVE